MTIKHLLVFIEVANSKNMSVAGKKLSLSQPMISQIIRELEEHYNAILFERFPRKLFITEDGKTLLSQARRVINYYNILEETMKDPTHNIPINFGATITIGNSMISPLLKELEKRYSNLPIKVFINNTREIERKIVDNSLDIALVEGEIEDNQLVTKKLMSDKLVIVCSKENELLKLKKITLEDIVKEPFILREKGSGTREIFLNYIKEKGMEINIQWECSEHRAIVQGVMDNHGISVISELLVKEEVDNGRLKLIEIEGFNFTRNFNLIYHKNKLLTLGLRQFITVMEEFCDKKS